MFNIVFEYWGLSHGAPSIKWIENVNSQTKRNRKLHCCIYFENLRVIKNTKKFEKTIDKHSELCYNIARWVCCYGSVGRAHPW